MIDPNEAPEGYEAVEPEEHTLCDGCVFFAANILCVTGIHDPCTMRDDIKCMPHERKDQMFVIFKEKKHE